MTGTIELDPDGKNLQIRFPYRPDLVEDVKTIPGRRWDRGGKMWRVPAGQIESVVSLFMRHGFTMTPEVTGLLAGTQGTAASPAPAPGTLPLDAPETDTEAVVETAEPPDALTVSGLNEMAKAALRDAFPETVWVTGEIADYDKNKERQHVFFTLVEKRGDTVVAQVSVAMFDREARAVRTRLANLADPMTLADGIEIRARMRVDLYPRNGRFQGIIEDIDASFTMGKLALGREEILRELREKGLEQRNRDLTLPVPPLRVGVLTSLDSDGYGDFAAGISSAGVGFCVTAYDVRVQGELVRPTVLQGLRYFAARSSEFDVLCILRGGGSRTDLSWFDDREIALAVARHPLKVICGIGHQRDQSVLDLIAHSEKTPTAVAGYLVAEVERAREVLADFARCLAATVQRVLRVEERQLTEIAHALRRHVHASLVTQGQRLGNARDRLARAANQRLRQERDSLQRSTTRVQGSAGLHLLHHHGRVQTLTEGLRHAVRRRLDRAAGELSTQAARQRSLDPTRVLQRGYALVRGMGGAILTGATQVEAGAAVDIQFRDGHARATIESTNPLPSRIDPTPEDPNPEGLETRAQ